MQGIRRSLVGDDEVQHGVRDRTARIGLTVVGRIG